MSTPYADWWRDPDSGVGLSNVFELRPLSRTVTAVQTVEIYRHPLLGRVLTLDGRLKGAEHARAWREMLCHLPLTGRDWGELRVALIGGGDGALLGELLRHPQVTTVDVFEPDRQLTELAAAQLGASTALADARVRLLGPPPANGRYDLMLLDCHDCAGRRLRGFRDLALAELAADLLTGRGVVVDARPVIPGPDRRALLLGDAPLVDKDFTVVHRYQFFDPLLPGGTALARLYGNDRHDYRRPLREFGGAHYTAALHRAAFALPTWLQQPTVPTPPGGGTADAGPPWFEHTLNCGISQALALRPVSEQRSEFQQLAIYHHPLFGRLLALDNTVQCSQADEMIYHEMAVHVPLLGRPRDRVRTLIIGGGDGGILRELLLHDRVSEVVMVEIDRAVVEVCNAELGIQGDYADPRVTLNIGDAAVYLAEAARAGRQFELIIVDATDSTSPSASLWNDAFFANLSACLSDDGVCLDSDILIHGNETLLSRDLPGNGLRDLRRAGRYFAGVEGYATKMPLFPAGYFALFLYTKDGYSHARPYREYSGAHYNPELHRAAFALPAWWRDLVPQGST